MNDMKWTRFNYVHADVLERTAARLGNAVYLEAVKIFESLEHDGKVRGNGHHMAQKVADDAVELLHERWVHDRQ